MQQSTLASIASFSLALGLGAGTSLAQDYPTKPVRIVTSDLGGGADFTARVIARGLTRSLGQNVIVDNRTTRLIGIIAAQLRPDGYTLMMGGGTFLYMPLLEKTSYDPLRDFAPISMSDTSPNVLVVHPSVAANSVKELIALAKAKPGTLNYGSGAPGGSVHLAGELFKSLADVNIIRVAYKGAGPATIGLMSGEVQLVFSPAAGVAPLLSSNKLRALAVTGAQPSPLAPGLPTVAASGLPGYEVIAIGFLLAPAKTPTPIVKRLNQEIVRVLNRPDVKEAYLKAGIEAAPSSPEMLAARMKAEFAKVSKVIKDAGIKVD